MATVKGIEISGTIYDNEDETARTSASAAGTTASQAQTAVNTLAQSVEVLDGLLAAVKTQADSIEAKVGDLDTPLDTTAQNLINAINELNGDIEAVSKSKYKIQTQSWNAAGNRYMKLSNMFASSAGLMTTTYLVSSRNGEAYLLLCGNSDGDNKSTPQVIKLSVGTDKLGNSGFSWDANTGEIAIMTQGYNIVQITQIAGERTDFTIGGLSTSNPLTTPTALTVTSLVPTSTVTSGSTALITSGGVANEINPTLTATFTKSAGLKSGGVTISACKKIGENLAVVSGYINQSSVLTVGDYQSNIGSLSISGKTVLGTNPISLFIWSQGQTPQCASCAWKVTGGWLAVPWHDGEITISEDVWFNAIVRYQ